MFRTDTSVGMLKAIALIAGLAILLWSLGLPSLRFATAANLSSVSDTISDSAPSAVANHDIEFINPLSGSGVPNGDDIVITFNGGFDLSYIGEEDIDLLINGVNKPAAEWSTATSANSITITITTGSIAASSTTQVLVGLNATNEGSPNSQIENPASEGSYEIDIVAGTDTATTHIVVLDSVLVTAAVDTVFTFSVSGVGAGVAINGTDTTSGTSSTTSIPFGTLEGGAAATTTAQQLTVNTNASQGYVVTIQTDGPLESTTGGVIDGFNNGSETNTPGAWAVPSGDVELPTTWGHWGITSDDATTTRVSQFGEATYIAASTSPRIIMSHDGPVNGAGTGVGTSYVGFKVEITNLQEAGDDYSTTLTYIATPTF